VPSVTVIIPTFNWSSVLPYSIGSVLRQTFTDFELLVIGDACTDDSAAVVDAAGDSRVRWINLAVNTRHQSGPNNEGLLQARGELIAYLGHDDLWLPHHLQSLVDALDATACELAYSLGVTITPGQEQIWPTIPRPEEGSFSSPLCIVHRKRLTDELGGWRPYRELRVAPDVELWQRAQAAGRAMTFVPRLTGLKFPASWRRDVYQERPSHQQARWLARIDAESDLEARLLVELVVDPRAPSALPYRALVRHFVRETLGRLRRAFRLRSLRHGTRGRTIDDIRRFKGL
jgi:glycosyltransferase involved in cell wall biosynthesis